MTDPYNTAEVKTLDIVDIKFADLSETQRIRAAIEKRREQDDEESETR